MLVVLQLAVPALLTGSVRAVSSPALQEVREALLVALPMLLAVPGSTDGSCAVTRFRALISPPEICCCDG